MSVNTLFSQITTEWQQLRTGTFSFTDSWSLRVNNYGNGQPVIFDVKIKNTGTDSTIAESTSRIIELPTGMSTFTNLELGINKFQMSKDSLGVLAMRLGKLPTGKYEVCIQSKNAISSLFIQENCFLMFVQENSTTLPSKNQSKASKVPVNFSGNAELRVVVNNSSPPLSNQAPSYADLMIAPSLRIAEIPISGRLQLSTLNSPYRQQLNFWNLSFDTDAYKQILRDRLKKYIESKLPTSPSNMNLNGNLQKLNSLNKILNNPEVIKELKILNELDSLKNMIRIPDSTSYILQSFSSPDSVKKLSLITRNNLDSLSKNVSENKNLSALSDSISKVLEKFQWLENKREGYAKLLQQKNLLVNVISKENKVDSIFKTVESINSYRNKIMDASNFESTVSELKKFKLLKSYEKYLGFIDKFQTGMSVPFYSDLTLSGVPVNGINLSVSPFGLYVSGTYGTLQSPVIAPGGLGSGYRRKIAAAAIGYGSTTGNNVRLNWLSVDDDEKSVTPRDSLLIYNIKPRSNKVLSLSFNVSVFKKLLRIKGEIAGSQTIQNKLYQPDSGIVGIDTVIIGNNTNWFVNIFRQKPVNLNTTVGYAGNLSTDLTLFEGKTTLTAQLKTVSRNFQSFGTPFLLRNLTYYDFRWKQKFWKNRIQFGTQFRLTHTTQPLDQKVFQFRYGFDVMVTIPKFPTLKVNYMPVQQQADTSRFSMNVLTTQLNYQRTINKQRFNTSLLYMFQDSYGTDSLMSFKNHMITVIHTLQLAGNKFMISLNGSWFYNKSSSNNSLHSLNLTTGLNLLVLKKWNNSTGTFVFYNKNEKRWGAYYQTGYALTRNISFTIRFDISRWNGIYSDLPLNTFVYGLNSSISARW